jgi:hypothetical protein
MICLMAGLLASVTGCKSVPQDPATPQAGLGYLDFYAEQEPESLSWDIQRYDAAAKRFVLLYSTIKANPARVVRVAIAPGEHLVRVGFLNQPITAPATLNVSVREGMVTPVKVDLSEGETRTYSVREQRYGPTARGHVGRVTEVRTLEGKGVGVSAQALSPVDYKPSASMPYARASAS